MSINKTSNKYIVYYNEIQNPPQDYKFVEYNKHKKIKKALDILIYDLLDYVDEKDYDTTLNDLVSCLTKDGTITIQSVDAYALASALLNKQIGLDIFSSVLNSRKRISTLSKNMNKIKELGLSIIEAKFINGLQYYIRFGKLND